jgi:DNA-binding transcriptional ArsR family regulator
MRRGMMAVARKRGSEGREVAWAEAFKAMGDPTRLSIVLKLVQKEHCVTDLAKALKVDAPVVSFHLTKLKYSRLVVNERRGQQVFYMLNPAKLKDVRGGMVMDVDGCLVTFKKND